MENAGMSSIVRNRWLDNYFEAILRSPEPHRNKYASTCDRGPAVSGEVGFSDDDRWISVLISVLRIAICVVIMMATTIFWTLVMLVIIPWPYLRVRQGNLYGHFTGWLMVARTLVRHAPTQLSDTALTLDTGRMRAKLHSLVSSLSSS